MKALLIYLRLYGNCAWAAARGIASNAWTVILPIALTTTFGYLELLLGLVLRGLAGFVIGFVMAALASCYLYFVGEIVGNAKVSVKEFRQSIGSYFWSVVNVLFVVWIAEWILGAVLSGQGNLRIALYLVAVVLFNAAPEVIYQRGTYGGLATFQASVAFLQESWIEWGLPNLLLLGLLYELTKWFARTFAYSGPFGALFAGLVPGILLHFIMVFRGHLFRELSGSSHRQRMFKYRNSTGLR